VVHPAAPLQWVGAGIRWASSSTPIPAGELDQLRLRRGEVQADLGEVSLHRLPDLGVTAHPAAPRRSRLVERWDLVAFGTGIGTAYSELTGPLEQRRRLEAQSLKAASGDVEAMGLDEDFLDALEHGMPPTGGLGTGVDRVLMMLTGTSIRQTVLFPFVRPVS
jgi:hypothetical protein